MSTKKLDLIGLRQQFVESRERVKQFAMVHGQEMTTRQKRKDGSWVPIRWRLLCTQAVQYYEELIAEIDAGTYVCRYGVLDEHSWVSLSLAGARRRFPTKGG